MPFCCFRRHVGHELSRPCGKLPPWSTGVESRAWLGSRCPHCRPIHLASRRRSRLSVRLWSSTLHRFCVHDRGQNRRVDRLTHGIVEIPSFVVLAEHVKTIMKHPPLPRRQMMRPSEIQATLILRKPFALFGRSIQRLVKFSVITTFVPFSCRLAMNTSWRARYDVNFTMMGCGLAPSLWSEESGVPRRWARSMHSGPIAMHNLLLHKSSTACSAFTSFGTPCRTRQFRRLYCSRVSSSVVRRAFGSSSSDIRCLTASVSSSAF